MKAMKTLYVVVVSSILAVSSTVWAEELPVSNLVETGKQLSEQQRLMRLERLMDNQGMVNLLFRIDALQKEVQTLRGQLELQHHELDEIKKRQRSLYSDVDRRLLNLERRGNGGSASIYPSTSTPLADSGKVMDATSTPAVTKTDKPASGDNKQAVSEQQTYQKAFDLLRELRYEDAITAFRTFLNTYPNGRYAHIAQYWISEANYAQRKFEAAIKDYQALIKLHPSSPKLAEAMLKISYSYYELKKYDQAERSLESLLKEHAGTTEAGQAQNLLQQIKLKKSNP